MTVVRTATRWEYAAAARVLGEAFVADPTLGAAVAGAVNPADVLSELFELMAHDLFGPNGAVDLALSDTGEPVGAALWAAPGTWPPPRLTEVRLLPSYARILGRRLPAMARSEAISSTYHPRFPHWYLFTAGASAAARGRGVGTALLRAGLGRAEAESMPCYLEATTPASARLYARLGFVQMGEIPNPYGDTRSIGMWRPAPGGAQAGGQGNAG